MLHKPVCLFWVCFLVDKNLQMNRIRKKRKIPNKTRLFYVKILLIWNFNNIFRRHGNYKPYEYKGLCILHLNWVDTIFPIRTVWEYKYTHRYNTLYTYEDILRLSHVPVRKIHYTHRSRHNCHECLKRFPLHSFDSINRKVESLIGFEFRTLAD